MKAFLEWTAFKAEVKCKGRLRYVDRENFYLLEYMDHSGNDSLESSVLKDDGADQTDFETNFKALANKSSASPTVDSDGTVLGRVKITTTGWQYRLHGVETKTSQLDSVVEKKDDGTDFGFTTIKCYDADDVELTTQGGCDTSAVKTVIDWEPTHDYEILGGLFKQLTVPTTDLRMWVIGVPDVSAEYGGSKIFMSNVNLKYVGLEEGTRVDGRTPKYLTYNATYHTNKIRIVVKHTAGYKHDLHFILEIFKA
jgi:hypothetical protein